jgi:hypothetical protein
MTETNIIIPSNDHSPEFSQISLEPILGNLTTLFSFTGNYSDKDKNAPIFINTVINHTVYPMRKIDPLDTNYENVVDFIYETYLPNGTYEYLIAVFYSLYGKKMIAYMKQMADLTFDKFFLRDINPSMGNT